jgi:hypothetical protein
MYSEHLMRQMHQEFILWALFDFRLHDDVLTEQGAADELSFALCFGEL